jgi:hypothetical protein
VRAPPLAGPPLAAAPAPDAAPNAPLLARTGADAGAGAIIDAVAAASGFGAGGAAAAAEPSCASATAGGATRCALAAAACEPDAPPTSSSSAAAAAPFSLRFAARGSGVVAAASGRAVARRDVCGCRAFFGLPSPCPALFEVTSALGPPPAGARASVGVAAGAGAAAPCSSFRKPTAVR